MSKSGFWELVLIVQVIISWVIVSPFFIYHARQYWRHRNVEGLRHRLPEIAMVCVGLTLFCFFDRTIWVLGYYGYITNNEAFRAFTLAISFYTWTLVFLGISHKTTKHKK